MNDFPKKEFGKEFAKGITVHYEVKQAVSIPQLIYARTLEVEWPSGYGRSIPMSKEKEHSWARLFAFVRIRSWQFQDAMPFIMFAGWLSGVVVSAIFSDVTPGGWPVAFAIGFVPVWLFFVALWPDIDGK
jgi:hypothetical protein